MSVRLLAIDTTAEFGSIALLEAGTGAEGTSLIEEVPLHSPDGFAHILFDQIERLLARHRMKLAGVGAFAAASGPGSFTGVRIGLAAIKGLAEATGKKAIAVSNLEAMASFGTRSLRAVVMDARRGEVYGAVYDAQLKIVREEVVMKFPDWLAGLFDGPAGLFDGHSGLFSGFAGVSVGLPGGELEFITNGFPMPETPPGAVMTVAPRALAAAIGKIALVRMAEGRAQDPGEIDANYVRRSDAELLWKDPAAINR